MKCIWRRFAISTLLTAALTTVSVARDWTRFRGPNGTGVSDAANIPIQWTDKDYNWKTELPGIGHSSPVVWDDKVFLSSADPASGTRWLLCIGTDGRKRWQKPFEDVTHDVHTQNSLASSTPAVDGRAVYMAWATPEQFSLVATDHNGEQIWRKELGPFTSEHGFGTSPVLYEDMVIITNDQEGESFVLAVDAKTGNERWRAPHRSLTRQNASYSAPCVYKPKDAEPQLIVNCWAHGITSLDPQSGKTNWEIGVFHNRPVSSPIIVGDLIFGTCGNGGGDNSVVAVRPPRSPGEQPQVAYKIEKSQSPYVPSLIAKDELVFAWTDRGIVSCIDASTGKTLWRERIGGNYSSSPIRIEDRIYGVSSNGDVVVLAADRQFKLLGKSSLGEATRATPAVSGGVLYLRTESQLFSLGGKKS